MSLATYYTERTGCSLEVKWFLQIPEDGAVGVKKTNSLDHAKFTRENMLDLTELTQKVIHAFLVQRTVYCLETHGDSIVNS